MHLDELKHYDEDTLVHFGVKGRKWGVRKSRPDGVSRSTNRQARKEDYGGHIRNPNQARLERVCTTK